MNKFIAILVALIASLGIYPATGTVTEVDRESDTVTFTTTTGFSFAFKGCEDWASNDLVSAILWDAGTKNDIRDDVVLGARYSGIAEDLPEAFPFAYKFESDFARDFPGQTCDLYGQKELTARTLMSRKAWEFYIVEVVTYTVIDEWHGLSDGAAPGTEWDMAVGEFPGQEYAPNSRAVCYLVYALNSDGVDDIVARYDYLLH